MFFDIGKIADKENKMNCRIKIKNREFKIRNVRVWEASPVGALVGFEYNDRTDNVASRVFFRESIIESGIDNSKYPEENLSLLKNKLQRRNMQIKDLKGEKSQLSYKLKAIECFCRDEW